LTAASAASAAPVVPRPSGAGTNDAQILEG